nr:hypothetical protein Itr_chr08CG19130 [Ipomoea trifida]
MIGWATTKLTSTTSHRHCFAETSTAVAGEPSSSSIARCCRRFVEGDLVSQTWKSSAIDKRTRKGEEDKIWCRRTSGFATTDHG